MVTLIHETKTGGRSRRCDANCYNATGHRCECICGGRNHGKGLLQAFEQTKQMALELIEAAATADRAAQ
jgi:hypothetical protein